MIVYEDGLENVKTNGVLYSQPEAVRKLAVMLMINAAEGNTDMVCDCPEEYRTKDDVERVFQQLNEQALEMLEDHICDLRLNLETFLRNAKFTASVRRMEYNKEGKLCDIMLDFDVE